MAKHSAHLLLLLPSYPQDLWGTEIYSSENRFGMYQGPGALEVLYPTGRTYGRDGYDWSADTYLLFSPQHSFCHHVP